MASKKTFALRFVLSLVKRAEIVFSWRGVSVSQVARGGRVYLATEYDKGDSCKYYGPTNGEDTILHLARSQPEEREIIITIIMEELVWSKSHHAQHDQPILDDGSMIIRYDNIAS